MRIIPDSWGADLTERWSDAARAASHAARRAKGRGQDWKKAGRKAFAAANPDARSGGPISAGDRKLAGKQAARYASSPRSVIARKMAFNFARSRKERRAARFTMPPRQPGFLRDAG